MAISAELRVILADLCGVGPRKPLGYLPLGTIRDAGADPVTLAAELSGQGLTVLSFGEDECHIGSGALYAFDNDAMALLLGHHRNLLATEQWALEPEAFVRQLATHAAEPQTEVFDVIADAFADFNNPNRRRPGGRTTENRREAGSET